MNPQVEAAWIAAASGVVGVLVGVAWTVTVAIFGFRSTRDATQKTITAGKETTDATIRAASADIQAQIAATSAATTAQIEASLTTIREQIEAERQNRIWEKRAATYVEAVKLMRHQQKVRYTQVQHLITGAEPSAEKAPVDMTILVAELIAYGTEDVLNAITDATDAAEEFLGDYWAVEQMAAGRELGELVQKARAEARNATEREEKVLDVIRAELMARAGDHPGDPIPRSRLGMEASLAKFSRPLPAPDPPAEADAAT